MSALTVIQVDASWDEAVEAVRGASRAGHDAIGLACSTAPSRDELARARAAGATALGATLFGARREVHDWHAPGSFERVVTALSAARSLGMKVAVRTPITRSNARVLIEVPALLKAHAVALWVLELPRIEDPATFTQRLTRLGLGVPAALAAIERAQTLGLVARVRGVPWCTLGPFVTHALASPPRGDAPPCAQCRARGECPRVDAAYVSRFGAGELRPLDATLHRHPEPELAALTEKG